eukprot:NODE_864_length_1403_cov_113.293205_g719_i0.p1 GENE.NODE_864_length_1403_cov_113.293205_g719_i0~~NODE_864_length_1403_cov_113.293205_g719_i0.p1  ORF type:complete len:207 (-),score=55.65 NODE_864_length_1403_cov_113.293205_g719_i0:103-723(-)
MPFPSYHSNPVKHFPARVTCIEGARDPCEELRAPRIRLAPEELRQRRHFLMAVQRKADEIVTPVRLRTLNLSYQNLGEEYQYDQLLAFLKINKGCTVLALTDNFLTDLHDFDMPYLEELFLARNNILSFRDIPSIPTLRRLSLQENFVTNLEGLTAEKFPNLVRLSLKWNPVAEGASYRDSVSKALPRLQELDGRPCSRGPQRDKS